MEIRIPNEGDNNKNGFKNGVRGSLFTPKAPANSEPYFSAVNSWQLY